MRHLFTLFFGVTIAAMSLKAEAGERYQLSIGSFIPSPGTTTEQRHFSVQEFTLTNWDAGHFHSTNYTTSLDIKYKCKTLIWDTNRGYGQIELTMEHCIISSKGKTNEPVKSGAKIHGTYIAGQWFFEPNSGYLLTSMSSILSGEFSVRPDTTAQDLERDGSDEPRSVGETWKLNFDVQDVTNRINKFLNPNDRFFSNFFMKRLDPKDVQAHVKFVGTTNLYDINSYDLLTTIRAHEVVGKMTMDATIEMNQIVPLDSACKSWLLEYSVKQTTLYMLSNSIPCNAYGSINSIHQCQELPETTTGR